MRTILFLLSFFLYFGCNAQSYLGKTKEEIYKLSKEDYREASLAYIVDPERPYLKLENGYETLYYYMEEDVCVEFVVVKPYTCNCLETDFNAYQENCIALEPFKWASKDYSKIYQMSLGRTSYSLSISQYTSSPLSSRSD